MFTVIFYQTNLGEMAQQPVLTGAEKEGRFTGQSCFKYLPSLELPKNKTATIEHCPS